MRGIRHLFSTRAFGMAATVFALAACGSAGKSPESSASAPASAPAGSPPAATREVAQPVITKTEGGSETLQALTCKKASEERKLEIEAVKPKGCKLWYTKSGERKNVARSS